jgi:Ca-activated chloride channel family protein
MPTPTTFRPLAALTLTLLPLLPACESAADDPTAASPTAGNGDPNRAPTWGKPGAPPLSVATAAAPLCAGAGSRESDGSGGHPGPFGDASQGTGGGAGGAGGGWAEEPWYDAGVSSSDGQVPPPVPDAGVTPPDASADAGNCGEPTFDADGGLIPAACDGGVVSADAVVDGSIPPPVSDADAEAGHPAPGSAPADAQPAGEPPARDAALPPAQRAQSLTEGEPVCPGIDLATPRVLYMSADDSNSMAAPVIVRRLVRSGYTDIPSYLIRPWEFLNYYRFSFDRPAPGELSVSAKLGSCNLTQDFALQIAVQSQAAPGDDRAPMHFVLVLDTSGSMDGEPMRLQQAAVRALAGSLRAGDRVSAVTWAEEQRPLIAGRVVEGADDPAVLDLVDGMRAAGGTNLEGGLRTGYELAERFREEGVLTRVVLISDGQANVGVTSEDLIGAAADDADGEGVYLVGVGVGDGVNDTLMDTVTDAGRGAYVYLDSEAEAARIFGERFAETLLVAARAVRIQVTLPPYFNVQKFYGEVYSPDPTKVRPQHLGVDDSMVLQQVLRPCDPSLPRETDELAVELTWQDPVSGIARQQRFVRALGDLDVGDDRLTKAAVIIGYTEALQALSRLDGLARVEALTTARQFVRDFDPDLADPDLAEIDGVLSALLRNHGGQ